ncbi:MAG: ABC transporter permease subunit [Lachnospiraceae bacterium]
MKHNLFSIAKKEFRRFFGDRRLFLSTVIMPGLMIYVMYTIMGQVMSDAFSTDDNYQEKVYASNLPASLEPLFSQMKIKVKPAKSDEIQKDKDRIQEKKSDMLLVFPEDFDSQVENYLVEDTQTLAPQIQVYYNSASTESSALYGTVISALDSYESVLANKFDVNVGGKGFDLATEEDSSAKVFSMIVPMLLIMMLISGCMSIAPDAIAGEKERGTMATLLVTPIRRSEIAFGKIISLSVIAILSGLSSFLGVMLSLPKLMGEEAGELSASVYSLADYSMLLLVVLSTVLVMISIFSLISTYAKNIKEAATISSPIMVVGVVVGIAASMGTMEKGLAYYAIPVYNSAQCMNGIFSMNYNVMQVLITVLVNIVFTGICIFIMTKMFDSEKIMFSK